MTDLPYLFLEMYGLFVCDIYRVCSLTVKFYVFETVSYCIAQAEFRLCIWGGLEFTKISFPSTRVTGICHMRPVLRIVH